MITRREFLSLAGLASAALLVKAGPLAGKLMTLKTQAESPAGKLYHGTLDGKILRSEDGGNTWALHTDLGKQNAVLGFSTRADGQVLAHISFQYRPYDLKLAKGEKFWMVE